MTAHPTPAAAWERFAAAIAARDPEAASRASTAGAWRPHGDAALLVFQTATEGGFPLAAPGPAWIEGDRAVLPVAVGAPPRASTLYVLLEQRDGSWGVSAAIRDERHASLFLAGVLPAIFEVSDLGPSPEGEQWARARLEELRASSAAEGPEAELLGVHALPARHRAVVGLRIPQAGGRSIQEWVGLDTSQGAPQVIARSSYPNLGLLLNGVHATLPAREAPEAPSADAPAPAPGAPASAPGAPAPDARDQPLGSEGLQLINAFFQSLAEIARSTPPLPDDTGRLPRALTEAIARTFEGAGQHREAAALRQQLAAPPAGASTGEPAAPAAPALAAPTAPTAPTAPAEDPLEPVRVELQRELDAFRNEKGLDTNEALLAQPFLAAHGQELAGRLLRVLANALPRLQAAAQSVPTAGPDTSS